MVGIAKAFVDSCSGKKLHIRRNYKSIYKIMLSCFAFGVIGLVVKTAGGNGIVKNKAPAVGKNIILKNAGNPKRGVFNRIFIGNAGESLVKISAGNYIVAFFILRL